MEADQKRRIDIQIPPGCLKELVVGEKTFRSACDFRLTEADLERSRRELNETEEIRKGALLELKERLSGDRDFSYRTDDEYLLRYLRYTKFRTKQTYKVIRNFYKTRKQCPDLFRVPTNTEKFFESKPVALVPYTDDDGDLVIILKCAQWDPSETSVLELIQLFCCISEMITLNPHVQINGVKEIWDFAGTGVSHFAPLLHPANLKLSAMAVQELYPWRLSRIVMINCNAFQYAAFATIRFFLKKKIAERIVLGADLCKAHEYINPAVLPKEYGGDLEDDQCYANMKKLILDNLRYLEQKLSSGDIPTP